MIFCTWSSSLDAAPSVSSSERAGRPPNERQGAVPSRLGIVARGAAALRGCSLRPRDRPLGRIVGAVTVPERDTIGLPRNLFIQWSDQTRSCSCSCCCCSFSYRESWRGISFTRIAKPKSAITTLVRFIRRFSGLISKCRIQPVGTGQALIDWRYLCSILSAPRCTKPYSWMNARPCVDPTQRKRS